MNPKAVMKILTVVLCICAIAAPALGEYIIPRIGGGSTVGFPMIMPEILFDGQNILIWDENGDTFPTLVWQQAPFLRAVVLPYEFDPTAPWSVLNGKAYNFQYGWDSAFLDEYTYPFPPDSGIWVEVLEQSAILETYYRDMGYPPIFGTKDAQGNPSSNIWYWDKGMRHNTYAVPDNYYGRIAATYKVYIGDIQTGAELEDGQGIPLYGSSVITFNWLRPCPYIVQGDIDCDCVIDVNDVALLAVQWLNEECSIPGWCDECDIDISSAVDFMDVAVLAENWLIDCRDSPLNPQCIVRPGP